MKLSIGIDVSKENLDVAFFNGNDYESTAYSNDKNGCKKLLNKIKTYDGMEIIVTMEATGTYHLNAATNVHSAGYDVSVVNPLVIRRYSEMKMLRAKTDPVDARTISEYGYEQKPYYFKPKTANCQKIVYYLKLIEDFLHMKSQNKNRIEAYSVCPDAPKETMKRLLDMNDYITSQIKETEKELKALVKDESANQYKRLMGIPGIGDRSSTAIIGYFNNFEDFENAKQVVSFIGMNPSPCESGTSVKGKGTISRQGNVYLRKLFYMASLSASKHNESCKLLYDRLLENGKDKKLALVAVANKLIRQVFAIVKYEREYISSYHMENVLT